MPLSRRIIGLVSLLQRCRRARASAGTLGSTHEPTLMQTTLVLRRTMRITSASPQSYSFLDLTGPHRGPPYAQYGHCRHIMGLHEQQARRRTMPHNVTPDLARSWRKVTQRAQRGFHRLEKLPTPKKHELTVKSMDCAVSWPYVTGQQRGSRPYIGETDWNDFSLGDYVNTRLEVNCGLELYTHRGSGCDNF
jgi:hypothetical protein